MECPGWGHLTWTAEDGLSQSPVWGHLTWTVAGGFNRSRRYGVTLLGSLMAVELVEGLRRLQDASGQCDSM